MKASQKPLKVPVKLLKVHHETTEGQICLPKRLAMIRLALTCVGPACMLKLLRPGGRGASASNNSEYMSCFLSLAWRETIIRVKYLTTFFQ